MAPLGRWSAATFLMQLMSGLGALGSLVVTARALGPEARGVIAVFSATVTLSVGVCAFGVPHAVLHFVGRGAGLRAVLRRVWPMIVFGGATIVVVAPHVFRLGVGSASMTSVWLALVIAAVLAAGGTTVLQWFGLGLGRFAYVARARAVSVAASLGAVIFLWQLGRLTALSAAACLAFMWGLYGLLLLRGLRPLAHRPRLQREPAGVMRFALQSAPSAVGDSLGSRLDQWLVGLVATTATAGIYSVALGISEVILLPAQALGASLFAGASRSEIRGFPLKPVSIALGLSAATAGGVAASSAWGVRAVFGTSYAAAIGPMVVLALGTVFLAVQRALGPYMTGRGHPAYQSGASLVTAAVLAVGVGGLTPRYGALGAAWGATIGYIAGAAFTVAAVLRLPARPPASCVDASRAASAPSRSVQRG